MLMKGAQESSNHLKKITSVFTSSCHILTTAYCPITTAPEVDKAIDLALTAWGHSSSLATSISNLHIFSTEINAYIRNVVERESFETAIAMNETDNKITIPLFPNM